MQKQIPQEVYRNSIQRILIFGTKFSFEPKTTKIKSTCQKWLSTKLANTQNCTHTEKEVF